MSNERKDRFYTRSSPPKEFASHDVAQAGTRIPLSVNFHILHQCNYGCRFCYFSEQGHVESLASGTRPTLSLSDALEVQRRLAESGVQRITYAGGEPTLSTDLEPLVLDWHRLQGGRAPRAMIVTNGTGLNEARLQRMKHALAAVKLSAESSSEFVETALKRGYGGHIALVISRADCLHRLAIPVDLNSVICRLNWQEDLTPLVRRVRPRYWKVFQMLPVPGQNDVAWQDLLISAKEFQQFVDRHAHLSDLLVPEDNDVMRGSYAMVDPVGRFFQSTPTGYARSRHSILDVGVEAALAEVPISWVKYDARGGDARAFGTGGLS